MAKLVFYSGCLLLWCDRDIPACTSDNVVPITCTSTLPRERCARAIVSPMNHCLASRLPFTSCSPLANRRSCASHVVRTTPIDIDISLLILCLAVKSVQEVEFITLDSNLVMERYIGGSGPASYIAEASEWYYLSHRACGGRENRIRNEDRYLRWDVELSTRVNAPFHFLQTIFPSLPQESPSYLSIVCALWQWSLMLWTSRERDTSANRRTTQPTTFFSISESLDIVLSISTWL